jgi:hypothetical protein
MAGMDGESEDLPRSPYVAGSAAVQEILDRNVQVEQRVGGVIREVEGLRCRVASEEEDVVAEVDGLQRLTGVYLEPGVLRRYRPAQLAALITETVLATGHVVREEVAGVRARYFLSSDSPDG